jgi:hypothetical protein
MMAGLMFCSWGNLILLPPIYNCDPTLPTQLILVSSSVCWSYNPGMRRNADKIWVDPNFASIPQSALSQPLILDYFGTLKHDMLGMQPSATTLSVWKNVFGDPSGLFTV